MNLSTYHQLIAETKQNHTSLIVVTKNQTVSDILQLYQAGQRDFGENRVQFLIDKKNQLPSDIQWHMIGHLQRNKIKSIISWIYMIQSVDSFELAEEINKAAFACNRKIPILLEVKIADEENKYGFNPIELINSFKKMAWDTLKNIDLRGLMGIATLTNDHAKIISEFKYLKELLDLIKTDDPGLHANFNQLSMGMSGDYKLAIQNGSTMIRIGSKIFN